MTSTNTFDSWTDAQAQANFRADLTDKRYRVWREPNNRVWNITETHEPVVRRSALSQPW